MFFGIGVGLPFLHLLTGMVIIQVRHFAPIGLRPVGSTPRMGLRPGGNGGMLEYWKNGFWPPASRAYGSEKILQYWVNGKIHLDAKV